ncbi:MAG TPA: Xaa-Pro peptidase family protein [Terriglobales bacterium]|nr:Xaa-Pro peptidase family protein [Terriglobales bacterium]
MDYHGRLGRVQTALDEHRLHSLLVSHLPNIRYLCGFTGSAGILIITARDRILITDGRYTQQAKQEVNGARVKIVKKSALAATAEWFAKRKNLRRVGIEAAHMTVGDRATLAKALGRSTTLIAAPPIVENLRMIKDADEIARIRAACQLGVKLFRTITEKLRPGIPESEVAGELELAARKAGVEQMSFPTIIAGGERSALPHGRASNAAVPDLGFVVCDFGVILAGYCSDMTRTVHVGQPSVEAVSSYEAVREAQQAALDAVKPGVSCGEVDHAARKLLYNRKLAKFFAHSTGHGVGLEIHEAPRIAAAQKEVLQAGMVITIEPGIYLPGKWGIRIEDTVVVTETGCEILTACPKELLTL